MFEIAALDRFVDKIVLEPNGCWRWSASLSHGYGHFCADGRRLFTKHVRAHRFAYEWLVGPIPEGLTLDHLCRNKACVNPSHLEPVTNRENILRGENFSAINARKTHCKRGHEFSPENTIKTKHGRNCRTCVCAGRRRRRAAWRAA